MVKGVRVIFMAALLVAGCATAKDKLGLGGSPTIDDSQLSRLPPDSLNAVNASRMRLNQAEDNVSREEARVQDAKNDLNAAKAEEKANKQQQSAVEARIKAATDRRDDQAAQTARDELTDLQAKEQVVSAHVEAAKAGVDVANAYLAAAEKQRELTGSQLEFTKYQTLKNANDPAANKYKQEDFEDAIRKNQDEVANARRDLQAKEAEYQQRQSAWQQAQQKYTATARPSAG